MTIFNRAILALADPNFPSSLDEPEPAQYAHLLTPRAWALARRSHSGVPYVYWRADRRAWQVRLVRASGGPTYHRIEQALLYLAEQTGAEYRELLAMHQARRVLR